MVEDIERVARDLEDHGFSEAAAEVRAAWLTNTPEERVGQV